MVQDEATEVFAGIRGLGVFKFMSVRVHKGDEGL
jgi:hypothetical protein